MTRASNVISYLAGQTHFLDLSRRDSFILSLLARSSRALAKSCRIVVALTWFAARYPTRRRTHECAIRSAWRIGAIPLVSSVPPFLCRDSRVVFSRASGASARDGTERCTVGTAALSLRARCVTTRVCHRMPADLPRTIAKKYPRENSPCALVDSRRCPLHTARSTGQGTVRTPRAAETVRVH